MDCMRGRKEKNMETNRLSESVISYFEITKEIQRLQNEKFTLRRILTETIIKEGMYDCLTINFSRLARIAGTPNPKYMK